MLAHCILSCRPIQRLRSRVSTESPTVVTPSTKTSYHTMYGHRRLRTTQCTAIEGFGPDNVSSICEMRKAALPQNRELLPIIFVVIISMGGDFNEHCRLQRIQYICMYIFMRVRARVCVYVCACAYS